jgi:hypothetical protein
MLYCYHHHHLRPLSKAIFICFLAFSSSINLWAKEDPNNSFFSFQQSFVFSNEQDKHSILSNPVLSYNFSRSERKITDNRFLEAFIEASRTKIKTIRLQNQLNILQGNRHLNQYLIILDSRDLFASGNDNFSKEKLQLNAKNSSLSKYLSLTDKDWGNFITEKNNSFNKINDSKAQALNESLIATSRSTQIETYLLLINYLPLSLPLAFDENTSLKDILSGKAKEESINKAVEKIKSESALIFNRILNGQFKGKGQEFFCGFTNYYALFSGDKSPRRYSMYSVKSGNESDIQMEEYITSQIRNSSGWAGTDVVRTEKMVSLLDLALTNFQKEHPKDLISGCAGNIRALNLGDTQQKAAFDADVKAMASLIDLPSVRNKSKFIFRESGKNIGWFDLDNQSLEERLTDKLSILANGHSEYKLILVIKEINYSLTPEQANQMAQQVHANKGFENKEILVVLPYYKDNCVVTHTDGIKKNEDVGITYSGIYSSEATLQGELSAILTSGYEQAKTDLTILYKQLINVYKQIPKDRIVYAYSFLWDGGMLKHEPNKKTGVKGSENIYHLIIDDDGRYEELIKLDVLEYGNEELNRMLEEGDFDNDPSLKSRFESVYENILQTFPERYLSVLNNESLIKRKVVEDLRQTGFTESVADQIAKWRWEKKTNALGIPNPTSIPNENLFYGGKNVEAAQDILTLLDIASTLSAFVGLDVVFDTYGCYYASKYNLLLEGAIYCTAATVQGVSPVAIKGLRLISSNGVKQQAVLTIRKIQNTRLVIETLPSRQLLATNLVFDRIVKGMKLESYLSKELFEQVYYNKEVFKKLLVNAKNKGTRQYVPKFEQAFNENKFFREWVKSKPDVITDFFRACQINPDVITDYFRTYQIAPSATVNEAIEEIKANLIRDTFSRIKDDELRELLNLNGISKLLTKTNVLKAINELGITKRSRFFESLSKDNNFVKPPGNLLKNHINEIEENHLKVWEKLDEWGNDNKKVDFDFLDKNKNFTTEDELRKSLTTASDVSVADLIKSGMEIWEKNVAILKTTEAGMAEALEKAFQQGDRSVFREETIKELKKVFDKDWIGNKQMASQVREGMIKELNETIGKSVSFDELMNITEKNRLNIVSQQASRGAIFESWFEHNFTQQLGLRGKKSGKYKNPLTNQEEPFTIDCHYFENNLVVGVELKHIDDILTGEPLNQLRRYIDIIKNRNLSNIPLKRIEYIFSKEIIANKNKRIIKGLFDEAEVIDYGIYYISSTGIKMMLK